MADFDPASMQPGDEVEIGVGPWNDSLDAIWMQYDEYAFTHWPVQFECTQLWRLNGAGVNERYHVVKRIR